MVYLQGVIHKQGRGPGRCRFQVVVARTVALGIVDFARREQVDRVAMYASDRKGSARFIRQSVVRDVRRRTPVDVTIFTPEELVAAKA